MILIVEDDPISRRALTSLFTTHGYAARAVSNAEDALATLKTIEPPEMMLIDIDLPGMNGLELLGTLQRDFPHLPCTLMSANDHDLSPNAGGWAVPFMPKPLDCKRLLKIVEEQV